MTTILSFDPASNKATTSNTGVVLIDNGKLLNYWCLPYGVEGIKKWYEEEFDKIKCDIVIFEHFEARDNSKAKDNSPLETIAEIKRLIPEAEGVRNGGYKSDIPDSLLKKLGLWKFGRSHHNDVRAAARLALFYAMRNDVEDFINGVGKELYERI